MENNNRKEDCILEDISLFVNRDKNSYAFYDMVSPLIYQNQQFQFYQQVPPSDIVTMSEESPYPSLVINAITPFTTRVYFGILSKIFKHYCIVNNSVYFWPTNPQNGDNVEFYVEENSSIISSVCVGNKNPDVYKEECLAVILYGIDDAIRIIPVHEKKIFFEDSITVPVNFIATEFHTTKSGHIFVATNEGDIYSLSYKLMMNKLKCETKIENVTKSKLLQKIPIPSFFTSNIVQMVVDEDSQILASLDYKSVLRFYKIEGDKLNFLSKFDPKIYDTVNAKYRFINICNIPLCFDSSVRFIGFYQEGTRVCFTVDNFINLVAATSTRPPPPLPYGDMLFSAAISLSHCVFICEKSITIARESHKTTNEADGFAKEVYCSIPINCELYAFAFKIPNMLPTYMVKHPSFWQHVISPQPSFLMSTNGTRIINFLVPSDLLLSHLLEEQESDISSKRLNNWVCENYEETFATALLLAAKHPEKKQKCLVLIMTLANQNEVKINEFRMAAIDQLQHHFASAAFLIRIGRILSGFWAFPILVEKNNIINEQITTEINPKIILSQIDFLKELSDLSSLCNEYFCLIQSSNLPKPLDIDRFPLIAKYISKLINIITFVRIIVTDVDPKILSAAMIDIGAKYRHRLVEVEFGSNFRDAQSMLFDSLHELCMKLVDLNPNSGIFSQIESKCPSFFDRSDILVLNSIKMITNNTNEDIISKNVDILIQNISRPMNVRDICTLLKEKEYIPGIFKLCLAKADFDDPSNLAQQWFLYGRSTPGSPGQNEFDSRYKSYIIIFENVGDDSSSYDKILKTDDILFHICFYSYLKDRRKLKLILSKTTPFLKQFIEKEAPNFLWRYLAAHGEYELASINLWDLANKDCNLTLWKRIKLFNYCIRYAFANQSLKNEATIALNLAQIQNELRSRTNNDDDYGYVLFDAHDLFIECAAEHYWDLLLWILSFSPTAHGNKGQIASQIWQNYLIEFLHNVSLQDSTYLLEQIFRQIQTKSEVSDLSIIIPLFENFKHNKGGPAHWAIKLLTKVGFNTNDIGKVYMNMIFNELILPDIKCDLIDCFAYIIGNDAADGIIRQKVAEIYYWFSEHGKKYHNYEGVLRILGSFL